MNRESEILRETEQYVKELRQTIAAHDSAWSRTRTTLYAKYDSALKWSILGGFAAEFGMALYDLRGALRQLEKCGFAAFKHKQAIRQLGLVEIKQNKVLSSFAWRNLSQTEEVLEKSAKDAMKYLRSTRADISMAVTRSALPTPAIRDTRGSDLGAGLRAEHERLVEQWVVAIEAVAKEQSTEAILQATGVVLDTIDLPSYVPRMVERLCEVRIASVGREIDTARDQYVEKKNALNRELRTAEGLLVVTRSLYSALGFAAIR